MSEMSGGMARISGALLKLMFVNEPFEIAGVPFTLASGKRLRIHAKLGCFIQDGGAHKLTWHTKRRPKHAVLPLVQKCVL